jgi:TrmH family RNA methyltransferase
MSQTITSIHNPRLKTIAGLREKRQREHSGLMLVDGEFELTHAIRSGARVQIVLFCADYMKHAPELYECYALAQRSGAELISVSVRAFEKIAYRDDPDGWVGVFYKPETDLNHLKLSAIPLIVIIESVEKPGNLGAILRTADAVGADAVISCNPSTDLTNPNVVRASKGAIFSLQIAEATTQHTLEWLAQHGIVLVAATPASSTLCYDVNMRLPIAIAVGEEKHGLSEALLSAAQQTVHIPMRGRVNSLNVSNAAAVLLYEALRQRMG